MMTVAELTAIADRLYQRWEDADREADQAQQRADALHREWAKAKRRERAAIASTPENVEAFPPHYCWDPENVECPMCNGDGDDLQPGGYGEPPPCPECDGTGRSTPENVECQT